MQSVGWGLGLPVLALDDGAGALASDRAALDYARQLAAQDPGNAEWQRVYGTALWRLAELPGGGVRWAEVWADMDRRGIAAPKDRKRAAAPMRNGSRGANSDGGRTRLPPVTLHLGRHGHCRPTTSPFGDFA